MQDRSDIEVVEKEFSNFEVSLSTGSLRKQRLSNKLAIKVTRPSSVTEIRLTLRDARVLKAFLDENLD